MVKGRTVLVVSVILCHGIEGEIANEETKSEFPALDGSKDTQDWSFTC